MLLCYGVLTFVLPVFWIFLSEINLFNYWKIQREVASLEFSTYKHTYRKVASSRLSWLVAHLRLFRLFMKRKFDAYLLWPLVKWDQNWIVDWSTACYFTVGDTGAKPGYIDFMQVRSLCYIFSPSLTYILCI